jgi:hypothetical protein
MPNLVPVRPNFLRLSSLAGQDSGSRTPSVLTASETIYFCNAHAGSRARIVFDRRIPNYPVSMRIDDLYTH